MTTLFSPQGLNFDGTNDYIDCGSFLTESYTKEVWMILSDSSTEYNNLISGKGGHAFRAPNNVVKAGHSTGSSGWNDVVDPNPVGAGWQHYAVTYDADTTTMKLYRNGNCVDTNNTVEKNSISSVLIGAWSGDYNFKGTIGDVRIWDHARTADEIMSNRFTDLSGQESGLLAYYKFDQADATSQTSLADHSPNGRTGTLNNFSSPPGWNAEIGIVNYDFDNFQSNPNGGFELGYKTGAGQVQAMSSSGTYGLISGVSLNAWGYGQTLTMAPNTVQDTTIADKTLKRGDIVVRMQSPSTDDFAVVKFTAASAGTFVIRGEYIATTPISEANIKIAANPTIGNSVGGGWYRAKPINDSGLITVAGGIYEMAVGDSFQFEVGLAAANLNQEVILRINVDQVNPW